MDTLTLPVTRADLARAICLVDRSGGTHASVTVALFISLNGIVATVHPGDPQAGIGREIVKLGDHLGKA